MRARLIIFSAVMSLISAIHGVSADQSPLGLWQAVDDDTKQPTGWFLITQQNGVYTGKIARMFLKPG
jgi:hypothetical protein